VLLLAMLNTSTRAVVSAALICGLAAGMAALTVRLPERLAPLATLEALIAGVLIGVAVDDFEGALAYTLVPTFVAGLTRLPTLIAAAVVIQVFCINLLTLADVGWSSFVGRLELCGPWLIVSVGGACLAYLLAETPHPLPPPDDTGYESAHRLLAQLRTVARRLSQGLDPVSIAQQMLAEVDSHVPASRALVLTRSDGEVLQPLVEQGDESPSNLTGKDPLVMECWANEAVMQRTAQGAGVRPVTTVAVPLQVGTRMVGVVLLETATTPAAPALATLREALAEHCIRLDTALLFDEVRTLATAEERRRLAREIHDGIAQEIASIGYVVDSLVAEAENADQREGLRGLRREVTRLTSELRLSIFDLRSEVSPSNGLGAVLSDHVRQVGSRSGLTVHLTLAEGGKRLPTATETDILRIAQEAISNCRKHANARNVHVTLVVEAPYAQLTITDDGRGLGTPREDSFGLRMMKERAERIDATLRVRNRTTGSHGTEVTLVLEDRRRIVHRRRPQLHDDVESTTRAGGARVADSQRGEPSDAHVGPAY
jgi:signal transduction histidine kinase